MSNDNATAVFLFLIVSSMFVLSFYALAQRNQCEQMAMAQNYPADSIRKICK